MQPKYFSFDTEGKRIYIDMMTDFLDRLKTFTFRHVARVVLRHAFARR